MLSVVYGLISKYNADKVYLDGAQSHKISEAANR
jgi:hypothetical protein